MKYICFMIACFVSIFLWSCSDCGEREEPKLQVFIKPVNQQAIQIDSAYTLGANWSLSANNLNLQGGNGFVGPLNINADSTQYILRVNGQRGVLTVRYRREFSFKSEKCGYVIELTPPANRMKDQYTSTTLGKIIYIEYLPNSFQTTGNKTFISLSIQL